MTPTEVVLAALAEVLACGGLVLLDDPEGLVQLPEEVDTPDGPVAVIEARANLEFRLRYEPRRDLPGALVVHRLRADVFAPDVEARAADGGQHLRLTPRRLLELATGETGWPDWVDQEGELIARHLPGILRAWRPRREEPLTPTRVEAILLRGVFGLEVETHADQAETWLAFFREERALRRLHKRRSPLAQRLGTWLKRQCAPVGWLTLDEPSAAVRLTWLVALLQPHLPDMIEALPRLYPGAQPLDGEDATALARVAYRLERLDPELAAAQRDAGEAVLAGPLRGAVVKLLRLTEPASAARLLRRETRSGQLVLMALRTLLGATAADQAPHELVLEGDLLHLAARTERFSHATAVREHAELLRCLLRLDRARVRLAETLSGEVSIERLLAAYTSVAYDLESNARRARQALTDNVLSDTALDSEPNPARHKAVVTALYCHVQAAEEQGLALERRLADLLLTPAEQRLPKVDEAWDEHLEPRRQALSQPRSCVVLVAGLSWEAWEQALATPLSQVYDVAAEPLLAPLPATGEWSLQRAVGGMRWRPGFAARTWDEWFGRLRPELGLRPSSRPPEALRPLVSAGLVKFVESSRGLCVVGVDLLAGEPAGAPAGVYRARLAALREALAALAHSGRRDELVTVLGTSGAVRCVEAPGLALPGEGHGARAVAADGDEEPPGTRRVPAAALGLPGEGELLLAGGRARLVPAAAGKVMADGGLSLAELVVPWAMLIPVPRGERSQVAVGPLVVPDRLLAGQPVELCLDVTLTGGSLAEVATVSSNLPGTEPVSATLDLGEPRRLNLTFTPELPAGGARAEIVVEVTCQVGRRTFRRRTWVTLTAPAPKPVAPAPGAPEVLAGG